MPIATPEFPEPPEIPLLGDIKYIIEALAGLFGDITVGEALQAVSDTPVIELVMKAVTTEALRDTPVKPGQAVGPSPTSFTVKAEVEFQVKAGSPSSAYRSFQHLMSKLFTEAYQPGGDDTIALSRYEGLSVIKNKA